MTDLTSELHRLHWRLGLMLVFEDNPTVIRGCADQHRAALDEWLKERETV